MLSGIHKIRAYTNRKIVHQLRFALSNIKDSIPCFIVCYNNPTYVVNMVKQLNNMGVTPIVFDNGSKCKNTIDLLKQIHEKTAYIVWCRKNLKHKVGFQPGIFENMPKIFAYTDPDLMLNKNLPSNFLEILYNLTTQYKVFKAGFSLKIESSLMNQKMLIEKKVKRTIPILKKYSIVEWESQYWRFKLQRNDDLIIYSAPIDTTFGVYNKNNYFGNFTDAVRVAGDYEAIHLPWYPTLDTMLDQERKNYLVNNKSSTWKENYNEKRI